MKQQTTQTPALTWAALAVILLVTSNPALAQSLDPGAARRGLPRDRQQELPAPEFAPPAQPRFELPPVPPPRQPGLGSQAAIEVRRIDIVGNTVLPDATLRELAAAHEGRAVTLEELFRLKDDLTRAYIEAGYVNSGAVLPDQAVTDGVVRYEIIEGQLESVAITGLSQLDPGFLERRIRQGGGRVLNVNNLQERLQLLLLEPTIDRLDARLGPGSAPGQARLEVAIEEAQPFSIELRSSNDESPSIGANKGELAFTWRSVLGRNDPLSATFGVTEGLRKVEIGYAVPLTAWDLRFHIDGQYSNADIVDDEVEILDIESKSRRLTVGFSAPLLDTVANRIGLDLSFERERTESFLLGEGFSFSRGADEGQTDLSMLRFTQDWLHRGRTRAIAAASTFTIGLDVLGATSNDEEPDGQFLSWLGQAEVAQRLFGDDELGLRGTLQLTEDPLLASEQFTAGGLGSVRGYRVNEVVRDNGWTVSIEYRKEVLPWLMPNPEQRPDDASLAIVPFFDAGGGWNHHRFDEDAEQLASVGIGLRGRWASRLQAELYWGLPLIDRDGSSESNLQDAGIGFRVTLTAY